jgi:Transcription elongation factor, N-terminal
MNRLPMTVGGHSALEDELTHRIRIGRPRLIQRIQEAIADDSNLAENPEYQAAKAEQEMNEASIAELEDKLARAEIIAVSKLFGDTIKFGATVTVIEEGSGAVASVWFLKCIFAVLPERFTNFSETPEVRLLGGEPATLRQPSGRDGTRSPDPIRSSCIPARRSDRETPDDLGGLLRQPCHDRRSHAARAEELLPA